MSAQSEFAVDAVKRIELVELSRVGLEALAAADLPAAAVASGYAMSDFLVAPDSITLWTLRLRQIVDDPAAARWVTRLVIDSERGLALGFAGYHGPPNENGMVEVGYAIAPEFRRQGYARAALHSLLERADGEPSVSVVRASVSPDNPASAALIAQYGFERVGEQWDAEDGLELVYEVASGAGR